MASLPQIAEIIDTVAGVVAPLVQDGNPFNLAASPDSSLPLIRQAQRAQRAACDIWASNPGGLAGQELGANSFMASACKKYLDNKGTPIPEPRQGQNFTGGQCDTAYSVYVTSGDSVKVGGVFVDRNFSRTLVLLGPIHGVKRVYDFSVGNFVVAVSRRDGLLSNTTMTWDLTPSAEYRFRYARIESVTRVDGLPDTCGDPQPFPGSPITSPINFPADPGDPWLPPFTINPPGIGDGGKWTIPINLPGIGDVDFAPNVPGSNDAPPAAPGSPGSELPPLEPGEELELIDGQKLWGARIEATDVPPWAGSVPGTMPRQFPNVVGNIAFLLDSSGNRGYGENIQVRQQSLIVKHPFGEADCVGLRFASPLEFGWQVYPILLAEE